jgi:S-layer homology domain
MSNDQRPHRLRDDEPIALLVAFLAFGAIFAWALSQGRGGFDPSSWLNGTFGGDNQGGLFGSLTGKPSPMPSPTIAPDGTGQNGNSGLGAKPIAPNAPQVQPSPQVDGSAAVDLDTPQVNAPQVTVPGAVMPSPAIVPPAVTPVPVPSIAVSPNVSPTAGASGAAKPTTPGVAINFPDVPQGTPEAAAIAALSAKGVVSGLPDGTYKPERPVTRAEYAVQLQKAFTKPSQLPPKAFADVPQDYWGAVAIDNAVKSNFMSGYSEDNSFRPDQQITRTEAIIALVRGLGIPEVANPDALLQGYGDQAQVPKWARSRIAAALQAGLLDPKATTLNPSQPATRGDVAKFVYNGLPLAEKK